MGAPVWLCTMFMDASSSVAIPSLTGFAPFLSGLFLFQLIGVSFDLLAATYLTSLHRAQHPYGVKSIHKAYFLLLVLKLV